MADEIKGLKELTTTPDGSVEETRPLDVNQYNAIRNAVDPSDEYPFTTPSDVTPLEDTTEGSSGESLQASRDDHTHPKSVGLKHFVFEFRVSGNLTPGAELDAVALVPYTCAIQKILVYRGTKGSVGTSTIIDINKGSSGVAPVTLYTTQANRPTITAAQGDYKVITATQPDIQSLAAGDFITIDIDQAGAGAKYLSVAIYAEEAG